MKIEYPKYNTLAQLNSEDFITMIYLIDDKISTIFNSIGFAPAWTKKEDAIEKTIKELLEECLKSLKKDETKRSASCATGMLRVELNVYDYEGKGELSILPEVLIEVWSS